MQINKDSVQTTARLGGLLYLIIIVIGVLGESVIRNGLIVPHDAAATAANILRSEFLWRVGVASQMFLLLCAVGLTFIFYELLRPVNQKLAVLVVFFGLVSLAVESIGALALGNVLTPLLAAKHLNLDPAQLHALAYLSIIEHGHAFGIALMFFGVEILIVGHLIRKSAYLPSWLGVLMQLGGLCYLINSFARVLFPSVAGLLFPAILLPALIGESAFCLWLLFKGVNVAEWKHQGQAGAWPAG